MTVRLIGLKYSGAVVLTEGNVCRVLCACGFEFNKDRNLLLKLRAKGFALRCWRCKRQHQSNLAKAQSQLKRGTP